MSRKTLFLMMTLLPVAILAVLFFVWNKKTNTATAPVATISETDEAAFAADVRLLDSLYIGLQKAVLEKDLRTTAEVNVSWEKNREAFLRRYATDSLLTELSVRLVANYRQRIRLLKETYRSQSADLAEGGRLRAAIKVEAATKEELKARKLMIEGALMSL